MKKQKFIIPGAITAGALVLLLLSINVPGFSDFYVKYVFPVWTDTYGRIFGPVRFSVGELLIYIAVVYAIFTIVMWVIRLFFKIRKKPCLKTFTAKNSYVFMCLAVFIFTVQINNCFVLYHTTTIYSETAEDEYEATLDDLLDLREKLMKRANELAVTFERDEKGYIIYDGDIETEAAEIMGAFGKAAYDRVKAGTGDELDKWLSLLNGYYSKPKHFIKSDFFSQQGIMGYYFPFTLEANYNDIMYIVNKPDTMCHELSHLKGFILEDEASFIAYLACINSGNDFFEYSGVMNVLEYVYSESEEAIAGHPEIEAGLTKAAPYVSSDSCFLTDEAWEEVEKDAVLDTETVNEASNEFLDTNLTINGVSDGILSYSRITELVLKYYYGGEK